MSVNVAHARSASVSWYSKADEQRRPFTLLATSFWFLSNYILCFGFFRFSPKTVPEEQRQTKSERIVLCAEKMTDHRCKSNRSCLWKEKFVTPQLVLQTPHVAGNLKLKTLIVWRLFCQGIINLTFTKNRAAAYVILSLRAASMLLLFQIISHLKKETFSPIDIFQSIWQMLLVQSMLYNFWIFILTQQKEENLFNSWRNQEMLFLEECFKNACWARSAWYHQMPFCWDMTNTNHNTLI